MKDRCWWWLLLLVVVVVLPLPLLVLRYCFLQRP